MSNIFKDEQTLGRELIRVYRHHEGETTETFLQFILPKHLLKLMAEVKKQEPPAVSKHSKKGK